jgi:hypothetical protein
LLLAVAAPVFFGDFFFAVFFAIDHTSQFVRDSTPIVA